MTVFTCNFWCFFRVPRGSSKSRQKSSQDLQKVPVEDFPGQFWGRLWFLGCPVWSPKRPGITKIMLKMTTENRFVLGGAPGCHFGCIFHDFRRDFGWNLEQLWCIFWHFQGLILDVFFMEFDIVVDQCWYTFDAFSDTQCFRFAYFLSRF